MRRARSSVHDTDSPTDLLDAGPGRTRPGHRRERPCRQRRHDGAASSRTRRAVQGGGRVAAARLQGRDRLHFTKDVVVIGYGQAFVESVLDAGPGPSLADDPRVASLVKRVGEENLGFTFVDIRAIRELFEPPGEGRDVARGVGPATRRRSGRSCCRSTPSRRAPGRTATSTACRRSSRSRSPEPLGPSRSATRAPEQESTWQSESG